MSEIFVPQWKEHELLDSGNGRKLERFGSVIVDRIETQAIWQTSQPASMWAKADAIFHKTGDKVGRWEFKKNLPREWTLQYEGLKFIVRLTPFGHVGVFPEQAVQWEWVSKKIQSRKEPTSVLNLFSYTGASTLVAAQAGAEVLHVDASKPAITWARDNQNASGLQAKKIRWIPDDAMVFVQREIRRGNHYDAIIMDPPKYGRGTKGEVWQFEDSISKLLLESVKLLSKNPLFLLVNAYAVPISPTTLQNVLAGVTKNLKGKVTAGELGLQESHEKRILPMSLFARWEM